MTVGELMEILEEMEPEMEIRFASQPTWPFEYTINGATPVDDVVYLDEGYQLGYLPKEVADELGW